MFDADQLPELKKLINEQAARDRMLLDDTSRPLQDRGTLR